MPESIVIGIDIAKRTFDAALGVSGSIKTFANDDAGFDTLLANLTGQAVDLIVMEATGGLESNLACVLVSSRIMNMNVIDTLWSLWAATGLWAGGGKRAAFSTGRPQDCA